jgi:hypothetical protein
MCKSIDAFLKENDNSYAKKTSIMEILKNQEILSEDDLKKIKEFEEKQFYKSQIPLIKKYQEKNIIPDKAIKNICQKADYPYEKKWYWYLMGSICVLLFLILFIKFFPDFLKKIMSITYTPQLIYKVFDTYWWTTFCSLFGYTWLLFETQKRGINKEWHDAIPNYLKHHLLRGLFSILFAHHFVVDIFKVPLEINSSVNIGYYLFSGGIAYSICRYLDSYSPLAIAKGIFNKITGSNE